MRARPLRIRRYLWALLVAGVLVGLVAWWVATISPPATGTTAFEFRKLLIQFLLIVALGAVVAFFVEIARLRISNNEQERQYSIEEVSAILVQLDTIYRRVKQDRHKMMIASGHDMDQDWYDGSMVTLREAKQDLEGLWRDVEARSGWLLVPLTDVEQGIKNMERYFDPIEGEWEAQMGEPHQPGGLFDQSRHPKFGQFRARSRSGGSSWPEFRNQYYICRERLIAILAMLRTGKIPAGGSGPRSSVG